MAAVIEVARTLEPLIRRCEDELEQARRPPDELVDALYDSGVFLAFTPREVGGREVDLMVPLTYMNRSGEAVSVYRERRGLEPARHELGSAEAEEGGGAREGDSDRDFPCTSASRPIGLARHFRQRVDSGGPSSQLVWLQRFSVTEHSRRCATWMMKAQRTDRRIRIRPFRGRCTSAPGLLHWDRAGSLT